MIGRHGRVSANVSNAVSMRVGVFGSVTGVKFLRVNGEASHGR
jgi:hypothetical protein